LSRFPRASPSLVGFVLFLAVTSLVYRRLIQGGFIADDYRWLEVSTLTSVAGSFVGPWGHGAAYRPLPRVTYLLDFWAFGYVFVGWIASNFALHAINSTLVYRVGRLLLPTRLESLCVALLFCVSPLAHENVAWVSGRTHLLCGLFVLLSTLYLARFLGSDDRSVLFLSLVAFFLALLSYEAAVYELFWVPVLVWRRDTDPRRTLRRRAVVIGAFGLVFGLYLALRGVALYHAPVGFYPDRALLLRTARMHLVTAYSVVSTWAGLGWPILLAVFMGAVFCPRRTLTRVVAAVGIFASGLLPFFPLPALSYRFFYVAQLGPLLVIGAVIAALLRGGQLLRPLLGAGLLVLTLAISLQRLDRFTSEWASSGLITRSLATQIHQLYPAQPAGMNFYIYGAPVTYVSVPLFISYLDSSVRFVYDRYRAFHGVILNSWELSNKTHLVASLRGQVVHARADCPSVNTIASPDFERLPLLELHKIVLACPAKYFAFDKTTLRISEVTQGRWLELVANEPGMIFLP
jgi:hypothetical protein